MTSEALKDIIGANERAWPRSYDTCIMHPCPRCAAVPYEMCCTPLRRSRNAKIPCMARLMYEWAN